MNVKELKSNIISIIPDEVYFYINKNNFNYKIANQLFRMNKEIPEEINSTKKVLITPFRAQETNLFEGIMGNSLYLKGVEPTYYLCEKRCKNCDNFTINSKTIPCGACYKNTRLFKKIFPGRYVNPESVLSFKKINEIKELSEKKTLEEIFRYKINDFDLGIIVLSSIKRYFLSETIPRDQEKIIRSYFYTALINYYVAERLVKEYDYLLTSHGVYVSWGVIAEVFYKNGKKVVTWGRGYRGNTGVFSHDYTYHKGLLFENNKYWQKLNLNKKMLVKLKEYMDSKKYGTKDFVAYNAGKNTNEEYIFEKLKIDKNKKIIVLFTNVAWDASIAFTKDPFGGMYNWLLETIDYFSKKKDLQLIIRVHPAEVTKENPARSTVEKAADVIFKKYERLPDNIKIVDSEHNKDISSYGLFEIMDAAIIYGSKIGVELTYYDIPTIVAGEAFCKNKGFTFDVSSKKEYYKYLDKITELKMSEKQKNLAKKYAYYYNFIRLSDIDIIKYKGKRIKKINIESWKDYNSEKFPQYNRIIDSIINSKPFHSQELSG